MHDAGLAEHISIQLLEIADAMRHAGDVRMHGDCHHAARAFAIVVEPVELVLATQQQLLGRRVLDHHHRDVVDLERVGNGHARLRGGMDPHELDVEETDGPELQDGFGGMLDCLHRRWNYGDYPAARRLPHGRRQHGAWHRPFDATVLDVDDGPHDHARAIGKLERRAIDDRRVGNAFARGARCGHRAGSSSNASWESVCTCTPVPADWTSPLTMCRRLPTTAPASPWRATGIIGRIVQRLAAASYASSARKVDMSWAFCPSPPET